MNIKKPLALALALALAGPGIAQADQVSDLKAQMEAMQKQMDALKAQLDQVTTQVQTQKQVQEQQEEKNAQFVQTRPGSGLTFVTPGGGDVTLYGNLDVSFDTTTKGLQSSYEQGGSPVGKMGWMPAISTNLSYLGARGRHPFDPRVQFRLAAGGRYRYLRDAGNEGHEFEHQRLRQRRAVFAEQFCRFHRKGLGRRHDRQVRDAVQAVN